MEKKRKELEEQAAKLAKKKKPSVPQKSKPKEVRKRPAPVRKKAKLAEPEPETSSSSSSDEDDDEDESGHDDAADGKDDPDLLNMMMATRAPSKNARGNRRLLGKSKRSSAYVAHDEEEEEEEVNADGGKKGKKGKKSKKKKKNSNDNGAGTKTAANAALPTMNGTQLLFHAQRVKSKGLQELSRKHSQRGSIMPSRDQLLDFKKRLASTDPLAAKRKSLSTAHLEGWSQWLWYMQLHYNLLFFGIGCKAKMLKDFVTERLAGEDVLSIDGSKQEFTGYVGGNRTVKALLDTISSHILKQSSLGASCLNLDGYARAVTAALDTHYGRDKDRGLLCVPSHLVVDSGTVAAVNNIPRIARDADCEENNKDAGVAAESGGDSSSFTWKGEYEGEEGPGESTSRAVAATRNPRFHRTLSVSAQSSSVAAAAGLGNAEADPSWGGRYAHAQAKLYIVVNSIDGECLQSQESQRVLATLAECSSVSLMATSDKVNAPLLWGSQELSKFRWTYLHVPTYTSYEIQDDFALYPKGTAGHRHAIEFVLASLSRSHTQLCAVLAKDALERRVQEAMLNSSSSSSSSSSTASSSNLANRGISFDELLAIASKKLIARDKDTLNSMLKELESHRLLSTTHDNKRQTFVILVLTQEQLQRVLDWDKQHE